MKICPPGRRTGKEAERHAQALADNPSFAAAHLVTQPVPPVIGKRGWVIMFLDVAGGSLRTTIPLSTMREGDLPRGIAVIVRSILSEWNPTPKTAKKKPVPFFLDQLGTRTVDGGPLDQFAQRIEYTPPTDTVLPLWLRISTGHVVPNAVAWARSDAWLELLGTEHLMVILGCAHGDLHANNVLVPQRPLPDFHKYRLIDLDAYSSSAPLARDPSHLLLAILINEVAELTEIKRRAVSEFLIDPTSDTSEHLLVAGMLDLAKSMHEVGEKFANKLGLVDHWQDQTLISLAANALLFAIRLADPSMQQWCLELSCAALGRFCARAGVPSPAEAPSARLTGTQAPVAVNTAQALEKLAAACDDWAASRTTILVLDSSRLIPEARVKISALRWKVVVDLNPSTDVDGGWACAANMPGDRRLFTTGQDPFFGRSSTVWLAAAGLSNTDPVDPGENVLGWRRKHFRFISNAIDALAQVSSHPATVVCMGEPRSTERAVVEACVDALGERMRIVVVAASDSDVLSEYRANTVRCNPSDLLQVVPDKSAVTSVARAATLPGHSSRVSLSSDLVSRFTDSMDLLHSEVGTVGERDGERGAFYKGRPITWYELNLGLDVDRRFTSELVNLVRASLKQRNTLRVMLTHTPGAGGTTMARRAAWDLKDEYPTVYVRGNVDESVFIQAVNELAQLCNTSVLVVVELVPGHTVRNVFEALRANTVPVVLLIISRRSVASPGARTDTETSSETDRHHRSIHVGALGRAERLEMVERFADLAPQRSTELFELAARPSENNVPFFYALT
ncbi:MAG: hypothetical protein ACRDQZ_22950, partial [Mycobacteriales bacterium]